MKLSHAAESMFLRAFQGFLQTAPDATHAYKLEPTDLHETADELVRAGIFTREAAELFKLTAKGRRGP